MAPSFFVEEITTMYVCLCAGMTESQLIDVITNDDNIDTIEDLAYTTGVCSGCQLCKEKVEELLGECFTISLNDLS